MIPDGQPINQIHKWQDWWRRPAKIIQNMSLSIQETKVFCGGENGGGSDQSFIFQAFLTDQALEIH